MNLNSQGRSAGSFVFSPIVVKQNTIAKPTTTSAIKENIANFDVEAILLVHISLTLRTFAAKTSNVQNFFKLLQEWDIVERIRKTKKQLGVTALLLQLGSIENDQIWSFLRYWVSLRHGGENTFRVSKTKKFWTFLVKDECSCNYKSVLDAVKRWNRPLEAFEG